MFNRALYDRLTFLTQTKKPMGIGAGEVKVKAEGIPMTYRYVPDDKRRTPDGKPPRKYEKLDIVDWGEMYSVCCPFCGDGRHRCAVSYKVGVWDERCASTHRHLWKCFNENCQDHPDNQDKMRRLLEYPMIRTAGMSIATAEAQNAHLANPDFEIPATMPHSLHTLAELTDDHPTSVFLRTYKGGWNPRRLARNWEVKLGGQFAGGASDRLIFPIREKGILRGYQARYVGPYGEDSPKGLWDCHECWTRWESATNPKVCGHCGKSDMAPVVKWNTSKGTKLGKLLYNSDNAQQAGDFVLVLEGPMDVIRAGTPEMTEVPGPAVGMFKSAVSVPWQSTFLYAEFLRKGYPVFFVWDDDAYGKSQEALAALLENPQFAPFASLMSCVKLPDGADPAGMNHTDLWSTISEHARRVGAKCSLTR